MGLKRIHFILLFSLLAAMVLMGISWAMCRYAFSGPIENMVIYFLVTLLALIVFFLLSDKKLQRDEMAAAVMRGDVSAHPGKGAEAEEDEEYPEEGEEEGEEPEQ